MSYDRFRNQREAYEETCRLIDNEFKRLNLDDWGDPKQPQGMSPQEIVAERNRQQAEKWNNANPLWEGLKSMDLGDWLDVGGQALQGAERVASGATFGAYDWLNRTLGGNYAERKQRLQEAADSAGIGLLNELTGAGLELAGNVAGGGGLLGKGLIKTGLRGSKLAAVGGGIDGMLNAGFATENLADLPQNLLLGTLTGSLTGYGLDKTLRKGMQKIGPWLEKNVSTFRDINRMRKGSTGDAGLDRAFDEARTLQTTRKVPKYYPRTMQEAEEFAVLDAKKWYDPLKEKGDFEVLDISQKLDRFPAEKTRPMKNITSEQAKLYLQNEASKIGKKLQPDIDHFTKDGRKSMVHTLANTYNNSDIVYFGRNQGVPGIYYIKKYQTDKGPLYDMIIQRNDNELFNKFPNNSSRYYANKMKGPLPYIDVNPNVKGIVNDIKDGEEWYLSKLGHMVNKNDVIKDGIANVRANPKNQYLQNLPDTDFQVLEKTGRYLDNISRFDNTPAGVEAGQAVQDLYSVMKDIAPEFKTYRRKYNQFYDKETAKNLANRNLGTFGWLLDINRVNPSPTIPVSIGGELSKYWSR